MVAVSLKPEGVSNLSGLDGTLNVVLGESDSESFTVCRDDEELRVALSWLEPDGEDLTNNLNRRQDLHRQLLHR